MKVLLCILCISTVSFAADYSIKARFDPAARTLEGEETITFIHQDEKPLETVQLHLYWNAFRDKRSTFMRESRRPLLEAGWIDIISPPVIRFLHPDDDNADDRTVAEVALPAPVEQGETVTLRVVFRARFPRLIARAGYEQDLFMAGQWFPKLGVMRRGLWNTHQYHATSEFFSEFGNYGVVLTVPEAYLVAASGDLREETRQAGLKTLTYSSEKVHDFAWAAWPHFRRVEDRWRHVKLVLYHAPDHRQAQRHLEAARATLEWLDRNVGPYPYTRLTIVDMPAWAAEAAGMEYPTLITTTMTWWKTRAIRDPELVTIHEAAHQYFYGIIANNEFEEAWLDEGFASYVEAAVADSMFGPQSSFLSLPGLHRGAVSYFFRPGLILTPDTDPVVQPSWRFWNSAAYGNMSYAKSLFLLRTVEQIVGHEAMMSALRLYFGRWQFRHPTTPDFLDALKEATGQDLNWFFRQALFEPSRLDYSIASMEERKVRVRRLGNMTMPVELTVLFADGGSRKRYWDGRERWRDFEFPNGSELARAEITVRPLDVNHVNNTFARQPDRRAAAKLAGLWAILIQHLLELAAWIV